MCFGIIRDIFVWIIWKMCIFAFDIREMYEFKTYNIMRKINLLKGWMRGMMLLVLFLAVQIGASAFTGSDLTSGQKYYLFNIYQAKFLGAGNKLQAPNVGTPEAFTATSTGFTIGSTAYTATKNSAGYYQLKSNGKFFAFEDKVADPDSPTDENRALYEGGGVTCKNTTNDTDRSYWQLISEKEYAEWQAKKKFTVSSLNVDGMPREVSAAGVINVKLNPDGKEGPGATAIGKKLSSTGWDIVGVSEDFNFHKNLYDEIKGDYNSGTHRGIIQYYIGLGTKYLITKEPLFDSDGLCFFTKKSTSSMMSESWTEWNDHYGFDDHGADGLIRKGFRHYEVKVNDDLVIDVYTTHMDAESEPEDNEARAKQLAQMVNDIKATVAKNKRPVIIIGDTNCRYTRDLVKANLIDAVNEVSGLTINDAWIEFGRGGEYPTYGSESLMARDLGYLKGEVVDKIFYINTEESPVQLVAETYHQDLSFVDENGSPLCDHKPCVVTFSYEGTNVEDDDSDAYTLIGEDPANGGDYYIYHPYSGKYLKLNVASNGRSASLAVADEPTSLWTMAPSGNSMTMKSGDWYFNLAKSGIFGTSATPNLSKTSNTTEIASSTTLNAFKIYREADPKRYLNYNGNEFTGAQNTGEQNDWVFISKSQYDDKQPKDYIENEVHYYTGIYKSNPTISFVKNGEAALDIDISKANIIGVEVDVTDYPNAIIYANKNSNVANEKNVVIAGKATNVEFVDGAPVYVPNSFMADNVKYSRVVTNKWGTIIFPTALVSNANNNGVQYYRLESKNDAETVLSFVEVGTLEANTPGAFVVENADGSDVTFINGSAFVNATVAEASTTTGVDGWTMTGLYRNKEINTTGAAETYYYIANNKFWDATGITLKGAPFRSFFTTPKSEGAKSFSIRIAGADEDATGIKEVAAPQLAVFAGNGQITVGANAASRVHIYNVAGAKVAQMNLGEGDTKSINLSRGIYVVNGVKVLVK